MFSISCFQSYVFKSMLIKETMIKFFRRTYSMQNNCKKKRSQKNNIT